jgi:hypothetical protein
MKTYFPLYNQRFNPHTDGRHKQGTSKASGKMALVRAAQKSTTFI